MPRADSGLRHAVQAYLPKPQWLWTPIETGATHQGVPDSFWAHEPTRTHGWIEHKATNGWSVNVRPHQISWLERHVRAGVRCHLLVRASGAGSANHRGDALWVVRGSAVRSLAEAGLNGLPGDAVLGRWYGGPRDWNWTALQGILTHDR
jgi:hypothetical protein